MKKYNNNSFWLKLFGSRIFIIFVIFLIFGVGYAIYNEIDSQRNIRNNIKNLEEEKVTLNNNNISLMELLKYYKSDEYIELQAREKLNMAREGERVVIVPNNQNLGKQDVGGDTRCDVNWYLWMKYFFGS